MILCMRRGLVHSCVYSPAYGPKFNVIVFLLRKNKKGKHPKSLSIGEVEIKTQNLEQPLERDMAELACWQDRGHEYGN